MLMDARSLRKPTDEFWRILRDELADLLAGGLAELSASSRVVAASRCDTRISCSW